MPVHDRRGRQYRAVLMRFGQAQRYVVHRSQQSIAAAVAELAGFPEPGQTTNGGHGSFAKRANPSQ
jgi:hypothetical protein